MAKRIKRQAPEAQQDEHPAFNGKEVSSSLTGRTKAKATMRLLICGDRHWTDFEFVLAKLETVTPEVVIEGGARGADTCARQAANQLGIEVCTFPAEWKLFGKAAGPLRNSQMLAQGHPTQVWAFHDCLEESRGTLDMVRKATAAGIPVTIWTHKN